MNIGAKVARIEAVFAPAGRNITAWIYFGVDGKPIERRPGPDAVYTVRVSKQPDWLPEGTLLVLGERADDALSPEQRDWVRSALLAELSPAQARLVSAARNVVILAGQCDP